MSLHFEKEDEVDRAAKEERHTPALVLYCFLYAIISGGYAWFRDNSLTSYVKDLGWLIAFGLAYWVVVPVYYEFRYRTKDIKSTLSAIEVAFNTLTKEQMIPLRTEGRVTESKKDLDEVRATLAVIGSGLVELQAQMKTIEIRYGSEEKRADMRRWEYRVITINTEYEVPFGGEITDSPESHAIIGNHLNAMGGEGWELVSFLPALPMAQRWKGVDSPNPWMYHAVFKRESSEHTAAQDATANSRFSHSGLGIQKGLQLIDSLTRADLPLKWPFSGSIDYLGRSPATREELSLAFSKALEETHATSFAQRGLVIKAARGHLKDKSFTEEELQSIVEGIDFLQRKPRPIPTVSTLNKAEPE